MLETTNNKVMLTGTWYSVGKKLVQVYIPATSSLYFGLSAIWGLPDTEQIVGTLAVVATFLGLCLSISSKQYDASEAAYDGSIVVETHPTGDKVFTLALDGDPLEIENKKSVAFKVIPNQVPTTISDPPQPILPEPPK